MASAHRTPVIIDTEQHIMNKTSRQQAIEDLRKDLRMIEHQIDQIVLDGGIIGLGDPLTRRAQHIRTQIHRLVMGK